MRADSTIFASDHFAHDKPFDTNVLCERNSAHWWLLEAHSIRMDQNVVGRNILSTFCRCREVRKPVVKFFHPLKLLVGLTLALDQFANLGVVKPVDIAKNKTLEFAFILSMTHALTDWVHNCTGGQKPLKDFDVSLKIDSQRR